MCYIAFTLILIIIGIPTALWVMFGTVRNNVRVVENVSLLNYFGLVGLAMCPVIILDGTALTPKGNPTQTLIHEQIHIEQQRELLVLPYYLLYFLEYLVRRFRTTHSEAYRKISFEREAYENENKKRYINKRPAFAWRNYF
jgi:hypothetical protein